MEKLNSEEWPHVISNASPEQITTLLGMELGGEKDLAVARSIRIRIWKSWKDGYEHDVEHPPLDMFRTGFKAMALDVVENIGKKEGETKEELRLALAIAAKMDPHLLLSMNTVMDIMDINSVQRRNSAEWFKENFRQALYEGLGMGADMAIACAAALAKASEYTYAKSQNGKAIRDEWLLRVNTAISRLGKDGGNTLAVERLKDMAEVIECGEEAERGDVSYRRYMNPDTDFNSKPLRAPMRIRNQSPTKEKRKGKGRRRMRK